MAYSAGATSELRLVAGPQPAAALFPAAMMLVTGFATLVAMCLTNSFAGVLATLLFGGILTLAWVAPLRVPLLVVAFLGLAVDRPGDTDGHWASPFQTLGGLLFQNLNKVVDVEALRFSGVFLLLACLLVVRGYRVLGGRALDTSRTVRPAAPAHWGIVLALLTILAAIGYGWLRGGDIQMAKIQTQAFLQLLAAAYLFSVSLRGPRDYRTAAKIIVAAASIKALMALWVRFTLPSAFPNRWGAMTDLEYATNHGDSLLFACAIAVLLGAWVHRPGARHLRAVLLYMPLIVAGLFANDRRIAWVEIAMVLIVLVGLNLHRLLTRRVVRRAVWLAPLAVIYVIAGWWSPARVFAPVHLARSLVVETRTDGTLDRSTLYRDAENYNLVYTFRSNPVVGTGFGHPFGRVAQLDDISEGFREFAYLPHNSILGLWAFTGAVGVTGILLVLVVAVFLAARAHASATDWQHAAAAAAAIGAIGAYILHSWGDIGFTEPSAIFLVGLAIAVAAQTATDTGAWIIRRRQPKAHQ